MLHILTDVLGNLKKGKQMENENKPKTDKTSYIASSELLLISFVVVIIVVMIPWQ